MARRRDDIWSSDYVFPLESETNLIAKYKVLNYVDNVPASVKDELKNGNAFHNGVLSRCQKLSAHNFNARYCPTCIMQGYHSDLHNLAYFGNCFLHRERKLLKVSDAQKLWNQNYQSLRKESIDSAALDMITHKNSLYDALYELDGKALSVDDLQILDFNHYSHRSQPYPISLEETIGSLARDEEPGVPVEIWSLDDLRDISDSVMRNYIVSTSVFDKMKSGGSWSDEKRYLDIIDRTRKSILAEYISSFILAEKVGKEQFYAGCSVFSDGRPSDPDIYPGIAAAMTVAAILNVGRPAKLYDKKLLRRGSIANRQACPVAPDELWHSFIYNVPYMVATYDAKVRAAYSFRIVSIVAESLYQKFLRGMQNGTFTPSGDMYRKRPKGLDTTVPTLLCVREGEMFKIYICE